MEYTLLILILIIGTVVFSLFQARKAYFVQQQSQRRFAEVARHWLVYFEVKLHRSLHDSEVYQCIQCVLDGHPADLVEESWMYLDDCVSVDNLPKTLLLFMVNTEVIDEDEFAKLLTFVRV